MNTTRSFRATLTLSLLGAALLGGPAFAISPDELASLRSKAEAGNAIAQYNLGLTYASLQEAAADPAEAFAWLNIAADNGATGKALAVVTSQLTSDQLIAGKKRLEELKDLFAAKRNPAAASTFAATPAVSVVSAEPITAAAPVGSPVAAPSAPVSPIAVSPVAASAPNDVALQNEIKKLGAELAASWKENEQLKASLSRAGQSTAGLDALKRERDQLAANLESTTREVATLRAAAANFEGERNALLQRANAAAAPTPAPASPAVSALNAATAAKEAALHGELTATAAKLQAAEAELAKSASVAAELASARQSLAALGEQAQKLTAENQRLAGLAANAASGEQTAASARAELAKSREETQAALALATTAQTATQQTAGRIKLLETDLASVSAQRSALEQKLAAAKTAAADPAESKRLSAQLGELKDRLSSSQDALGLANAETARLKDQLAQGGASLSSHAAELDRARQALAAAQSDRDLLAQRLAAAETAASSAAASLAAAAQPATPAPAVAAENDSAELRRQLEETQMKLDTSLRSFQMKDEEVDRLQKALADIDGERASLAARVQVATTEAGDATARAAVNNAAAAQLAAVREQFRQTQNQLANLANENAQLRTRLSLSGGANVAANQGSTLSAPMRPGALDLGAKTPARPAAAAPAPTPTPTPAVRTHTVGEGDTLTKIAKRYYGNSERWAEIFEVNRAKIADPKSIAIGTKLIVP